MRWEWIVFTSVLPLLSSLSLQALADNSAIPAAAPQAPYSFQYQKRGENVTEVVPLVQKATDSVQVKESPQKETTPTTTHASAPDPISTPEAPAKQETVPTPSSTTVTPVVHHDDILDLFSSVPTANTTEPTTPPKLSTIGSEKHLMDSEPTTAPSSTLDKLLGLPVSIPTAIPTAIPTSIPTTIPTFDLSSFENETKLDLEMSEPTGGDGPTDSSTAMLPKVTTNPLPEIHLPNKTNIDVEKDFHLSSITSALPSPAVDLHQNETTHGPLKGLSSPGLPAPTGDLKPNGTIPDLKGVVTTILSSIIPSHTLDVHQNETIPEPSGLPASIGDLKPIVTSIFSVTIPPVVPSTIISTIPNVTPAPVNQAHNHTTSDQHEEGILSVSIPPVVPSTIIPTIPSVSPVNQEKSSDIVHLPLSSILSKISSVITPPTVIAEFPSETLVDDISSTPTHTLPLPLPSLSLPQLPITTSTTAIIPIITSIPSIPIISPTVSITQPSFPIESPIESHLETPPVPPVMTPPIETPPGTLLGTPLGPSLVTTIETPPIETPPIETPLGTLLGTPLGPSLVTTIVTPPIVTPPIGTPLGTLGPSLVASIVTPTESPLPTSADLEEGIRSTPALTSVSVSLPININRPTGQTTSTPLPTPSGFSSRPIASPLPTNNNLQMNITTDGARPNEPSASSHPGSGSITPQVIIQPTSSPGSTTGHPPQNHTEGGVATSDYISSTHTRDGKINTPSTTTPAIAVLTSPPPPPIATPSTPVEVDSQAWVPTSLLVDTSFEPATGTVSSPTPTQTLPQMIINDTIPPKPPKTIKIQIGFRQGYNYPFVVKTPLASRQIFKYLPLALAGDLNIPVDSITMHSLQPGPGPGFSRTVAFLFLPSDKVDTLRADLPNPYSLLYQADIGDQIDPTYPLLATGDEYTADDDYSWVNGGDTGGDSGDGTGNSDDGSLLGGADEQGGGSKVMAKSAGIAFGIVSGAAVYGAAMFFVARRYRRRRLRHARVSSISRGISPGNNHTGALMGGAVMSGAIAEKRGSNGSGGRVSARGQTISGPMQAENSLGWN